MRLLNIMVIAALILVFAVRYRHGAAVNREQKKQNLWMEIAWLVGPIPLLVFIFYWGASLFAGLRRPPPSAMEINVVAKQWMWKFQHPQGQREIDTLHVPVGRPVRMRMVSQDVIMLNDTLAANVALGAAEGAIDEEKVLAALHSANLGELVARLPRGIHSSVGHNAAELSGGQRQRLAIARAIYKDAPVLILDEATSALDNESERLVQEALARLMKGRTTLVIAHRLSTIEHADEIVVMVDGGIVERGTHAELSARGGAYSALRNAEFRR